MPACCIFNISRCRNCRCIKNGKRCAGCDPSRNERCENEWNESQSPSSTDWNGCRELYSQYQHIPSQLWLIQPTNLMCTTIMQSMVSYDLMHPISLTFQQARLEQCLQIRPPNYAGNVAVNRPWRFSSLWPSHICCRRNSMLNPNHGIMSLERRLSLWIEGDIDSLF